MFSAIELSGMSIQPSKQFVSKSSPNPWIAATNKDNKKLSVFDCAETYKKVGKWELKFNKGDKNIDIAWQHVTAGILVKKSLMSAKVSKQSDKFQTQSILIYTYDYTDSDDVYKVYKYLAKLASKIKIDFIGYKLEMMTIEDQDNYLYKASSFIETDQFFLGLEDKMSNKTRAQKILCGIMQQFMRDQNTLEKDQKDIVLYQEERLVNVLANVLGTTSFVMLAIENTLINGLYKESLLGLYFRERSISSFMSIEEPGMSLVKLKYNSGFKNAIRFPEKLFLNSNNLESVICNILKNSYPDIASGIIQKIQSGREMQNEKPCLIM